MHFSSEGDRLITASFDNTARVNYDNNIKLIRVIKSIFIKQFMTIISNIANIY